MLNRENAHEDVYGKTFALYKKPDMEEFVSFFERRFEANGIDAASFFGGKSVLDAGCGNGRGAIFASKNGASRIAISDISPTNIESTHRNMAEFGFKATDGGLCSLEALPYPDNHFDVVWCNGVLMHTANPDKCLQEITRVLRPGGKSWIYVYGAGGIYWYFVQAFREIFRDVQAAQIIEDLQALDYSARYIGEYVDDWKAGHLRTYTSGDFSRRLSEIGYKTPAPLRFGVPYDTSHRINTRPAEADWWGEGDLRYCVEKGDAGVLSGHPISSGEFGSDYSFSPAIIARFGEALDSLKALASTGRLDAVKRSAEIQNRLRTLMSTDGPIDLAAIDQLL